MTLKKPDIVLANELTNKLAHITYLIFIEKENKEEVKELKKELLKTTKEINKLYSKYDLI